MFEINFAGLTIKGLPDDTVQISADGSYSLDRDDIELLIRELRNFTDPYSIGSGRKINFHERAVTMAQDWEVVPNHAPQWVGQNGLVVEPAGQLLGQHHIDDPFPGEPGHFGVEFIGHIEDAPEVQVHPINNF